MRTAILIFITALLAATASPQTRTFYPTPAWSPDGKWLAFTKMEFTPPATPGTPPKVNAEMYIIRADGSAITRVIDGGDKGAQHPVFSRDGKSLYFSLIDKQTRLGQIHTVGLDGKGLRQITANVHRPSAIRLSPDGKWLAFNATLTADPADRHVQIYVMRADGSGQLKQLTNDPKISFYSPEWSPDGKRIVYYVERGDNKDQIWSMQADGSDQKLLSANIAHNYYPVWTTDGRRIVFTSNRDGRSQLYTMNADGSDVKPLGIESTSVRYSPDGKRMVYSAGQFPNIAIYVANSDGTNPVKLLPPDK